MKCIFAILLTVATTVLGSPLELGKRSSNKCHPVKLGYFTVFNATEAYPVRLNSQKQVTYSTDGPKLQVEFQSCPKTGQQFPNLGRFTGQIVQKGTHNCLSVINDGGIPIIQLIECHSNTYPPNAQYFETGPGFVFWRGTTGSEEIGYKVDEPSSEPATDSRHRIEVDCSAVCASFDIRE